MSKARHKRSSGGSTPSNDKYDATNSNVMKEAVERKKGGRVADCAPMGKKASMRLDRPGRKAGGRVGADKSPLSSAASTSGRSDAGQTDI